MKRKLLILDSHEEYPNLRSVLSFFENKQEFDLINISSYSQEDIKPLIGDDSEVLIFSYLPDKVLQFLEMYPGTLPYFTTLDKGSFKEAYEKFKSLNKDIFVPRILISSGKELDLLEVSSLFQKSEIKSLKYINGSSVPVIVGFEGLSTFNYLNSLESGVLVPATLYDSIPESSQDQRVAKNKKWILQKMEIESSTLLFISYSVKYNLDFNLVWTDIKRVTVLDENLNRIKMTPDLEGCNFYLEIEKHQGKFYITKIFQGIHPYIIFNY